MKELQLVIFNSPPNSGKDTIGRVVAQMFPACKVIQFKDPLYAQSAELVGLSVEDFTKMVSNRDTKDSFNRIIAEQMWERHLVAKVETPRELLIHTSEKVYKPKYGKGYYGILAANSIVTYNRNTGADKFIFTDGGFDREVIFLLNTLKYNGYKVSLVIIQLDRAGCSFIKDSRGYLNVDRIRKNTWAQLHHYQVANNEGFMTDTIEHCANIVEIEYKHLKFGD